MKKVFLFLGCLLPWFLSSLVPFNASFYHDLTIPFFALPSWAYGIAWSILYFIIAIGIFQTIKDIPFDKIPRNYKIALLINYLFNQSFTFVFFGLENTFLAFLSCIGTFISSLFLYEETNRLNSNQTKYFTPYILFSLYATVLSLTIYVLNSR